MAGRDQETPPPAPVRTPPPTTPGGKVYVTRSGDTWDGIAFRALGSELLMDRMLDANPFYNGVVRFDGGAELNVPDLPAPALSGNLPPWRIA